MQGTYLKNRDSHGRSNQSHLFNAVDNFFECLSNQKYLPKLIIMWRHPIKASCDRLIEQHCLHSRAIHHKHFLSEACMSKNFKELSELSLLLSFRNSDCLKHWAERGGAQ